MSSQPQRKGVPAMGQKDNQTWIRHCAIKSSISTAGKTRIAQARVRRMAAGASDPAVLQVEEVRTWLNALLTAAGREDLLLPTDLQFDAAGLRTRMEGVMQSIQSDVEEATKEDSVNSAAAELANAPLEPSPGSVMLQNRSRGKVRQMSMAEIQDAARRMAGIPQR